MRVWKDVRWLAVAATMLLLGVACGGAVPTTTIAPTTAEPVGASAEVTPATLTATPTPEPTPPLLPTATPPVAEAPLAELLPPLSPDEEEQIRRARFSQWTRTNLSRRTVPLEEVRALLYPDDIPPIYNPQFQSPEEADQTLDPLEPVLALEMGSDARAYPLRILIWHEIVNDKVGGEAIVATY